MFRTHPESIRVGEIMRNHDLTVENYPELKNLKLRHSIKEAIAEAYN